MCLKPDRDCRHDLLPGALSGKAASPISSVLTGVTKVVVCAILSVGWSI